MNEHMDIHRINACFERAERGEELTIAFLGGSITQGALASAPSTCYAYLVYQWLRQQYTDSKIHYINAGIGGTDSQFALARVEEQVLSLHPDLVFVEFSVNDEANEFFRETFEGLLRKIYYHRSNPGVIVLNNFFYEDGHNAQKEHNQVATHYRIPYLSLRDHLYPLIEQGVYQREELTPDLLHPNDRGHGVIADLICRFLEEIREAAKPLTANRYERTRKFTARNYQAKMEGFVQDTRNRESVQDAFKEGWEAKEEGASIYFDLPKSKSIAIQYRKSVNQPAPIAKAILDGKKEILLDSNFQETWGDCLYMENAFVEEDEKEHQLEIRIVSQGEFAASFYLLAILLS